MKIFQKQNARDPKICSHSLKKTQWDLLRLFQTLLKRRHQGLPLFFYILQEKGTWGTQDSTFKNKGTNSLQDISNSFKNKTLRVFKTLFQTLLKRRHKGNSKKILGAPKTIWKSFKNKTQGTRTFFHTLKKIQGNFLRLFQTLLKRRKHELPSFFYILKEKGTWGPQDSTFKKRH